MYSIMLVDDEDNVLLALRRILSKVEDWRILTCNNPLAALDLAMKSHIDLFLSDYRMPDMLGSEFLMHTKRFHPHAMRLILSGATDFSGLVDAINKAEIHRFIGKPIQAEDLIATIKQALQLYDLSNENRLLAEQVRRQQEELDRRELALKRFSERHPVLAKVNWDTDGSIILDEEDL